VSVVIGAIEFFSRDSLLVSVIRCQSTGSFCQVDIRDDYAAYRAFQQYLSDTESGGFVFDFTTLFALFVYVFIGYLVLQFIAYISLSLNRRDVER